MTGQELPHRVRVPFDQRIDLLEVVGRDLELDWPGRDVCADLALGQALDHHGALERLGGERRIAEQEAQRAGRKDQCVHA